MTDDVRQVHGVLAGSFVPFDLEPPVRDPLLYMYDRWRRPWKFADPVPFPEFVLFPRVEKARRRIFLWRCHLAAARDGLRWGPPPDEDD